MSHHQVHGLHRAVLGMLAGWLVLAPGPSAAAESKDEKIRNEKVVVTETRLGPGEKLVLGGDRPSAIIHLDAGRLEFRPKKGAVRRMTVERGQTVFESAQAGTLKNVGKSATGFVRIEFLGQGGKDTWGTDGLGPHYKMLFENVYARAYDIRIAAGTDEPLHSHKHRVVVCLSGAQLKHRMPDGRQETSTLQTGEIAWRGPGTHVGQNIGTTDFWAIAIEPK